MKLNIEMIPVESLTPYEKNARRHQGKDVDAIADSIKAFGFNDPVGVWGKNNIVVEGHGRLMAAEQIRMKEVPCIRLDELTDTQRRAYALAHNKTAELSGWDFNALENELEKIADIDMTPFGFSDAEEVDIDALFDEEEHEKKPKKIQCPECGEWFEI